MESIILVKQIWETKPSEIEHTEDKGQHGIKSLENFRKEGVEKVLKYLQFRSTVIIVEKVGLS